MVSKSELLNNLREYTSDQIVEAINAGIVTVYELSKSGQLTPLMRRRIEEKLAEKIADTVHSAHGVVSNVNDKASSFAENLSSFDNHTENPDAVEKDGRSETAEAESQYNKVTDTPIFTTDKKEYTTLSSKMKTNKGMFQRPFSFKGRIRRMEYGISFIIYCIWNSFLDSVSKSTNSSDEASVFFLITFIPMMWFILAQNAKRCHDRGNSGWYQIIPFYGFILLLGKGEEEENDYGDNPKE